jgi:hypothetical protein
MNEEHDLQLLLRSRTPLLLIESSEEPRALALLCRVGIALRQAVFSWTATDGLKRMDIDMPAQRFNTAPADVLGHLRSTRQPGIYVLLDFHPWLDEPLNVRQLKDVALSYDECPRTIVLLSHRLQLPPELAALAAYFTLALPGSAELSNLVREQARAWSEANPGQRVRSDAETFAELVRNLAGLTVEDARRLARRVIFDDGAITESDLPEVMQAKHALLGRGGVLAFEYDTASFAEVGGLGALKAWLSQRRSGFLGEHPGRASLEPPRGVLLLGVQGGGKSLAARAVAGLWRVPLLRLDFGSLYDKFHGETERKLRESLQAAELMAPCVLWVDEIEKGIGADSHDGGTSKRVLGTLLTWMAERRKPVFLVATANDITRLPPELMRKGRVDEIFFVDLPDAEVRTEIFSIHLRRRGEDPDAFDLGELAQRCAGFSGAEIEQVVVSGLYACGEDRLNQPTLLAEIERTRPLSVVMSERISALRAWASGRTVSAN